MIRIAKGEFFYFTSGSSALQLVQDAFPPFWLLRKGDVRGGGIIAEALAARRIWKR